MATSRPATDVLCACIDIGSTTTRLLVAEAAHGDVREVLASRAFTQLGRGLRPGDAVEAAKVEEVARTVAAQVRAARELGVERLRAVGTAALRRAVNAAELCAAVRAASGVEVDVLSSDDEARLAWLGATGTLDAPCEGPVAVVDVGGGSTEVVVGAGGRGVSWSASIDLGSSDLTDACVRADPPGEACLARLRAATREAFAGWSVPAPRHALAVGGSATSLTRLVGDELTPAALARGLATLCAAPADELGAAEGLDPRRVRLLPAGIVLLEGAGALLGRPLRVARGGLREGVLLEAAA